MSRRRKRRGEMEHGDDRHTHGVEEEADTANAGLSTLALAHLRPSFHNPVAGASRSDDQLKGVSQVVIADFASEDRRKARGHGAKSAGRIADDGACFTACIVG